jgi:pilus assembly protein Flp/PilA
MSGRLAVNNVWIRAMMKRFLNDQSGATAIEYGLIAAAMGLALVTVMPTLAGKITTKFSSLGSHIATGK